MHADRTPSNVTKKLETKLINTLPKTRHAMQMQCNAMMPFDFH
jgi:hypothetical protein